MAAIAVSPVFGSITPSQEQQLLATNYLDFTGANGDGTTGAATVTVMYIQNNSVQDAVDL